MYQKIAKDYLLVKCCMPYASYFRSKKPKVQTALISLLVTLPKLSDDF